MPVTSLKLANMGSQSFKFPKSKYYKAQTPTLFDIHPAKKMQSGNKTST